MRSEEPTLEQLFAATRTLERRATPARRELRRSVAARLSAAGVTLSVPAHAAASTLGAASWLTAVKIKLIVVCLVAGGVATGVAWLGRGSGGQLVGATGIAENQARPWQHQPKSSVAHRLASIELPTTKIQETAAERTQVIKVSTSTSRDALADELLLVRGAQSDLARGHTERALASLNRYFQRFPSGILQPEAKATRVRALCQSGRVSASNREAARFSRTYPDSPLARQLRPCQVR